MKLKNKRTGEIGKPRIAYQEIYIDTENRMTYCYRTLFGVFKEWEVYEKPKEDGLDNIIALVEAYSDNDSERYPKEIVKKLKAWRRLKEKGFRFDGWEDLQAKMDLDELVRFNRDVLDTDNVIGFRMDDYHDCIKDLNTCFGGGK